MEIRFLNVTKDYGKVRALDGVTLDIGHGMFGLLGPNGAGKTTLMRILTTLALPTSGEVYAGGHNVIRAPGAVRQRLGYLPQEFGFFPRLNAWQMLDYVGTMKNIPQPQRRREVENALEQVNLGEAACGNVFRWDEAAPRDCAGFARQS